MISNLAESFTDRIYRIYHQHQEKSQRPLAAIADKQSLGKPKSHWTSETNTSARVAVQNPHWSPPPPSVGSFSPSSRAYLKPRNDLAAIAPSLSYSLSAPRSCCSSSNNSPPQTTADHLLRVFKTQRCNQTQTLRSSVCIKLTRHILCSI